MKTKNITLSLALAAVFSSSTAFAELEVTGKVVHESAMFTQSGIGIGAATTSTQTADSHGKDLFKTATQAKLFFDGEVPNAEDATMHVELNAYFDGKAVKDNKYHENYTQRDLLREAYIDAEKDDVSFRVGKQQVVWGTADGMKLLDAINPTDYSEMAQNQMEDSRIPVWMLNAEADSTAGDGGNWQFIVSEGKSSHFAGLGRESAMGATHSNGSQGNAFIMKGVDTITGKVNGFLNVAPALGTAAGVFDRVAQSGFTMTTGLAYNVGNNTNYITVNDFANGTKTTGAGTFGTICNDGVVAEDTATASCLAWVANASGALRSTNLSGVYGTYGNGAGNANAQNLLKDQTVAEWNASLSNPTETFQYLHGTTFATFDNFVDMKSTYKVDHKKTPTTALRYKNSTADGLNYSLNAIRGNDTNPYVEMHWENAGTGAILTETMQATITSAGVDYFTVSLDSDGDVTTSDVGGDVGSGAGTASDSERANLVMTEKLNTVSQIGGSFDTAIETASLGPVVLRGEALYQKGVMSPVIIREAASGLDLTHGALVSSVKMQKGDRFKYVLGADMTALTNMMVSVQFIQDRNLDYVDRGSYGSGDWTYTADMATMSLTNNLNKAEENKEFYSLFLSKPFGASGEHRWNNIFMFEENGGKWNRLDAEFSIDDDTQATVEYDKYWGDENTQFGQLEKSSNIQVGVKYSF